MRPLPVLAIIREAYSFTFNHLGAIIGLIWLPMVIATVADFFVQQTYVAQVHAAMVTNDTAALGPVLLGLVVYLLGVLLLTAMMYVAVTQLALGQRKGPVLAHFAFGKPEWRMARALLGLMLFVAPAAALLLMVASRVTTTAAGPMMLAASAFFLLLYSGMIFVIVRFAILLPAIVVAEDKPVLARGWALSQGNFWRLLLIALGSAGPVLLLRFVLELLLDRGAGQAVGGSAPLLAGLGFLLAPFILGLGVSASAFSYRALTRTDISV